MKKAIDPIVRLDRLTGRTALWLACALLTGVSMTALAGNPWFTSRTVSGKTKPITLMAPSSPTGGSSLIVPSAATFENGFVDVVVSLYKNPAGDNNGNTQANPPSEQDVIEQIVQFWADGMFEATQGAHILRRVRIFRNGLLANKADVTWITSGWPSSPASGVNQAGGHINFADIFLGGCGSGCDYNMLTDPKGAGYTLAHEWGHYAYGLFDEYKIAATDVAVVPSIMNSQWNATGGDTRWLNYSIVNSGGGDFQNTLLTFQHCNYSASCWEVLARMPANDPFQYPASSGCPNRLAAPRVFYPELAAVAPAGNGTPAIDLPNPAARGSLNIIWATDALVLQIVIDHSFSMSSEPDKMSNARAAAKLLVDQAGIGASIGVVEFNDSVHTVYPVTQVTDATIQSNIKTAIDAISPSGDKAIYDAAESALAGLQALPNDNDTKVVFLLSDGLDNSSSVSAATIITDYQNAQIPIFTFAYGSDADVAALQTLSGETGGNSFSSPTSLSAISEAFSAAFVNASSVAGIDSGSQTATAAPQDVPYTVDSSLSNLTLSLSYAGAPGTVTVQLFDPSGIAHAPQTVEQSGGETAEFYRVPAPTPGVWHLITTAGGGPNLVSYRIVGQPGSPTPLAVLTSLNGNTIAGPTPLILNARLDQGLAIVGAAIDGVVKQPDGSKIPVQFADDGMAPDDSAGDGIYTAKFNYVQNGVYNFVVRFNNDKGAASLSYVGVNLTPRVDGTAPDGPPKGDPVSFNFNRSASFQLTVSNAPILVCPSDIVVPNDDGQCSAVVSYTVTTAPGIIGICTPPSGSLFPLGTTTVTCIASGTTDNCSFTVTVEDKEAPRVACLQAANPADTKSPVAGTNPRSGQNPDGFYQLLSKDNCDPTPRIFIRDSASSFIAGPFATGDIVKITQSPTGTPEEKKMAGVVVAHIILKGDALLFASDATGNVSTPVDCFVPPPPN